MLPLRAAALLLPLLAAPAFVQVAFAQVAPPVVVTGAFARATPPGAITAAAYMTLRSQVDDRLTGVSSPLAADAMLHTETTGPNDMVHMQMMPDLTLPAGKKVTLQPGGMHIMLDHLKAPLTVGTEIPLHLTFAVSPPQDILVPVLPIGASGPH
jgi:copper(I)-binding protein